MWIRGSLIGFFVGAHLLVALGALLVGGPYYLAPEAARPDLPLHATFAPGRPVGLLLGMIGAALMGAALLYSARKWIPGLTFLGSPRTWMTVHLTCGLLGPVFILLHAGLQRPSGFIGVGFWCMVLVASSGFFGRYLFGYFPQGAATAQHDLAERRRALSDVRHALVAATEGAAAAHVAAAVNEALEFEGKAHTLRELVALDREIRRRRARIRGWLAQARLAPPMQARAEQVLLEQLALRRRGAGFDVARRLLRYWNLFHQPLALAMYLIVGVHILNAIVLGGSLAVLFGAP